MAGRPAGDPAGAADAVLIPTLPAAQADGTCVASHSTVAVATACVRPARKWSADSITCTDAVGHPATIGSAVSNGQNWSWRAASTSVGTGGGSTAALSGGATATTASIRGSRTDERDERTERVAGDHERHTVGGNLVDRRNDVEALAHAVVVRGAEVEADRVEPGRGQRGEQRVDHIVEPVAAVLRVRVADHGHAAP